MLTLGLSSNAFAAADDNEIWLQQSGTALTLLKKVMETKLVEMTLVVHQSI